MAEQKQKKAGLTISLGRRPKVLLLGNGMNRVYGGASWAGLLEKINRTSFTADQVKSMPFPMQAVLLSRDQVDVSLQDLQRELTQCEVHPWLGEQLRRLLAMPFDCILTPNFTYEVECALVPDLWIIPCAISAILRRFLGRRRGLCSTPIIICPGPRGIFPCFMSMGRPGCPIR